MSIYPIPHKHDDFHEATTKFRLKGTVHRPNGRVYSGFNGDLFYSPNSNAVVNDPPSIQGIEELYRDSRLNNLDEFIQPHWWSLETAYLAFVPLQPQFVGDPLNDLFYVPHYIDKISRQGYTMNPDILVQWKKVEKALWEVRDLMYSIYGIEDTNSIIDTAIGCTGFYNNAEVFKQYITRARQWFGIWMAQISYAIAVAETVDNELGSTAVIPQWFKTLLAKSVGDWDQPFLMGIRQSMGVFTTEVERAGVYVNVIQPRRHQFAVDWLVQFNIPVYYSWGPKEMQAASKTPELQRYAPPVHNLQEYCTSIDKKRTITDHQPWIAFMADRAKRTADAITHETQKEREQRLNRERKPPTARAKVYVWEKDLTGVFKRQLVVRRAAEDTLHFYSGQQRVYNAVFNEWDCGEELGDPDPHHWSDGEYDDGPSDSAYPAAYFNRPAENTMEHLATNSDTIITSQPSEIQVGSSKGLSEPVLEPVVNTVPARRALPIAPSEKENQWEVRIHNCMDLLHEHFGFIRPFRAGPKKHKKSADDHSTIKSILGAVGMKSGGADVSMLSVWNEVHEFISAFNQDSILPRNEIWDMAWSNSESILKSARIQSIHAIHAPHSGQWYLFDFGPHATVAWFLVVTTPADALLVCRMNASFNDYEITRELLNRGAEFRTFAVINLPPPEDIPMKPIPIRLAKYLFTLRDYNVYVDERDALLRNPRIARAAVMQGGIVWRLSAQSVSFDDVLGGPSAALNVYRHGVPLDYEGQMIWDDIITTEELDIICGLYQCFTGYGSQYGPKSWWPTMSIWKATAVHGYWTEFMEVKFQERLNSLDAGTAQPLTATEWRKWLRGTSDTRRIHKNFNVAATNFMQNLV